MDNEPQQAAEPAPALPRTKPFATPMTAADPTEQAAGRMDWSAAATDARGEIQAGRERTGVFGHLVKDDADITGLIAYSIYKQHKLDWLQAFEDTRGRAPDDGEMAAYIVGEGTPRRLATYRHLAEATLAGRGLDINGARGGSAPLPARLPAYVGQRNAPALVAVYGLIAILFVVGFWLALHFTISTR